MSIRTAKIEILYELLEILFNNYQSCSW